MNLKSEQPRFLKDRGRDIEAALSVLPHPTEQGAPSTAHNAKGTSDGDDISEANDNYDAGRLTLKFYLDSTWSEGAAFSKWVQDAANRMNLNGQ